MKPLLLRAKRGTVPFLRDPEALGCLLHEIVDIATQTNGEILIEDIEQAARALGYQGSISRLRLVLIAKGFVSEVERYKRFYLQEMNRDAIQLFFSTHRSLFSTQRMDVIDHQLMFEKRCIDGSEAEKMLLGVMKHTGLINEELQNLSRLDSETSSRLAFVQVSSFFAYERVQWIQEQIGSLMIEHDDLLDNNRDIEVRRRRFMLSFQIEEAFQLLAIAVGYAQQQEIRLTEAVRDRQRVKLLRSIRETFLKFSIVFLKSEEEQIE